MRFKQAILLIAIMITGACASGSQGTARVVNGVKVEEDKAGLWARATFSPDAAIKIALARVPGGAITEAELEEEDGRLVYSFEIKVAGTAGEHEVDVDATTGEVVQQEHEG
jgi:uncharacterized membrane protein YkoI